MREFYSRLDRDTILVESSYSYRPLYWMELNWIMIPPHYESSDFKQVLYHFRINFSDDMFLVS